MSYKEVAECFLRELKELGVQIKYNAKFNNYLSEKKEIILGNNEIKAEIIISLQVCIAIKLPTY